MMGLLHTNPQRLLVGGLAVLGGLLPAPAAVAQPNDQVNSQVPDKIATHPGTEDWLRKQIAGWEKHRPVFDDMTEGLAADTRERQTDIQAKFDALGSMQSLKFTGVENGVDVYLVTFDHGALSWMVAPLAGGKAGSSLFGGPTIRSGPSPGTEAAVRRLIAGYAAGTPAYDIMSPSLFQVVLPQQTTWWARQKSLARSKP